MVKVIARNKEEAKELFSKWNQRDGGNHKKVILSSIKVVHSDLPSPGHKMFNATLSKRK